MRISDLLDISSHFELEAKHYMRKFHILKIVLSHFVNEGAFGYDVALIVKEELSAYLEMKCLKLNSKKKTRLEN